MKKVLFLLLLFCSTKVFPQDIFNAIENKNYDQLTELVKTKDNVNARGKNKLTPLLRAVGLNDFKAVKILVENGADITLTPNSGWTPLMLACQSAGIEIASYLID